MILSTVWFYLTDQVHHVTKAKGTDDEFLGITVTS